jgi:hypothetical protein
MCSIINKGNKERGRWLGMDMVIDLEKVYQLFKEKVKDFQLISVDRDKRVEVKPYQLRLLSCSVPDYWLLVLESGIGLSGVGLYTVLLFTEDICLADFNDDVPLLRINKVNVAACLPFWVYLTREFLEEYSFYVCDVEEEVVDYLFSWAKRVALPEGDDIRSRYIMDVMELASLWNVESIMEVVDKCEEFDFVR